MDKIEKRNGFKIQLTDVGVFYLRRFSLFRKDRFWALKKVSLELNQGETLGVIGRNGVGKSTLLRILAGIIAPDQGKIVNNCGRASLLSLQVGFNPHLTGRDNAILSGMLLGMRKNEVMEKMDKIIAFAELESFIDQPIRTYSTGMKARLGFAVAFQADPDLLLIDEVIGVGDEAFRKKSTAAMSKRIQSDRTAVVVSHSSAIIKELCDRVIWIENGETKAIGDTESVLEEYQKFLWKLAVEQAVKNGDVPSVSKKMK